MLGEHAGRYEYIAVSAVVVGVIGAGLCAPPRSTSHTSEELTITLTLLGLGFAALAPYLLRALGRSRAEVTMLGAGLAFGWGGVATKLASDDLSGHHLLTAALWALATAAASGVGLLSETSALQSRPAIQVAPVVFVTQTVVPVVLAPLLLGERFGATPLGGVPLCASLALLVVGAALLARSPLLINLLDAGATLTDGELTSDASDSAASPSEASRVTMRPSPETDAADPSSSTTSTSPARIGR